MEERPPVRKSPFPPFNPLPLLCPRLPLSFVHLDSIRVPQGFFARPKKETDGSQNLMIWEVGIPGKVGVSPLLSLFATRPA
jgi:hypothetical protein